MHNLTGYGPRIITMDSQTIKWLVFNGKAENYPAWSTKFTAYMQTKGLYKALLGKEIIPEEIAPLAEDASNEQKTAWDAKVRERNKQIEEIQERNNTVWCHIALALDNNSLLYIRHDCLSSDGVGDGAKAWRLLQQRYSNVEKPTVVSLVRQISRLQLDENEKLSEYFIRAQELMSRLTEAGENISETLFNALVINGLPEKYEHFIVQESFNPAANFTELRTRLQNYDDSRLQRSQAEEDSATAMHSGNTSGNKGPSKPKGDCFVCGYPGHFAKQCSKRNSAFCSKCKKRGHLPKACRSSSKPTTKPNSFSSYSQCMNSGTETSSGTGKPNHLIIDTGCTDHIVTKKELFENLQPCSIRNVKDPKGNLTPVEGVGDVPVKLHLKDGKEEEMILRNVLYVPTYEVNLLSVNRSVKFGHKFIFSESKAKLMLNHGPQVDLTKENGLFYLKITFQRSSASYPTTCNTSKATIKGDINLWHQRLGHLNKDDVKRTIGCEDNLKEVCETCALGKQTSKPVPKETQNKSQKPLELVYSDILGPFEVPSLNGSRYAITFVDEYSKYSVVKFMSKKSEALEKFKEYVAESGSPRRLRTDNGAEYTAKKFTDYCRDSKIKQEYTVPETPQQNGVAERFNRTLVEMGRSLLIQAKLPKRYWVRALSTAAHIRNLTVTANSQGKSPFELFTGKPPRRNHLRVFGCTAYVMKRKINLRKLDSRSVKAKFIGYDDRSTAYILQEFDSKKVIKARNVIFRESEIQSFSAKETISLENPNLVSPNMDFDDDRSKDEDTKIPVQGGVGENNAAIPVVQNQFEVEGDPNENEVPLPRGSRNRRPPERYGLPYTFNTTKEDVQEPKSYNEAVNSPQAENWRKAMQTEYNSLMDNNTWTLVNEPEDQQVLPGKWVYKVKYGADGQVDKLKARYVAKGYAQVEGLDFFDTYAPTCKPETFRILLATAAQKDLQLGQMDVKSAYLHSNIEEEIYLEQPQGFVKKANSGQKLVCKLNKSIYGLKQAAKNWYEALTSLLLKEGFKRSRNDYCLFVRKEEDETFSYVLVWVDDIVVAGATEEAVNEIKSMLNENFKMDDRGALNWFLGMQILRSHDKITVDQKKYIETVLQQFNMSDCKAVATPGEVNLKLVKSDDEEQKLVDPKLYRSLVGSLLFIGKQTRPDILHIVNQLSRFLDKPNESHWKAAKHVLRYLKGTIDLRLTFLKNSNSDIIGDSDADWSGDLNDRKSTTGYYFKFEGNGGAISWEVKKQATVALSSAEAEYQAMAAAVQEAIYLRALLEDFGLPMKKPIDIGEDNQSCIKMCHNPVMHKRSKHIDTKLHFIRERVENKEVKIHYVPTEEMTADILTKSLPRVKVQKHRTVLLGN